MSGKPNQQDKNTILKGIRDVREAIKQSDFDGATKILKQIQPIIVRTKFCEFEFSLLKGINFDKQGKAQECIESARNAERLKPNDVNANRLLIHSYTLLKEDEKLAKEIISFFSKHANDPNQDRIILVDYIAPYLKNFDEKHHKEITLPFVQCFKKLSDYTTYHIASCIPETDDTVEIRCELLRPVAQEDPEACSDLVQLLLYEIPEEDRNADELTTISSRLPPNNQFRLLVETYFGPEPFKSAKKYEDETKNNKFQNIIEAFDNNDLKNLKIQLNYDPYFSSGWLYYGDQVTNLNEKLNAYEKALKANPRSIPILEKISKVQNDLGKIDDAIETLKKVHTINPSKGMKMLVSYLISVGKGDEADKYIGSRDTLSDIDRALISFLDYEKTNDKNLIRFILKLPVSPETAEVKARTIYELHDEIGKKTDFMFNECINQSKEGPVYLYYARWLDNQGLDKSTLIYEKAIEAGIVDDRAFDVVTRKLVGEDQLDKALQLCLKVNNEWSHFRAGLILQRQDKHELACTQFQAEIQIHPKNFTAWKCLAQSYLILGRAMATLSVVQFLKENGQLDSDLEFKVLGIFERPIALHEKDDASVSLDIENTPIPLLTFLQQKVDQIKNLSTFGREDTCKLLIERYEDLVDSYHKKWGGLGAVLRVCGQFYLESYKITKNIQHAQKSLAVMKRNAELDVRPETFIELSSVFIEMGKVKEAAMILQKVIHKFPDNAQLWTNLGVALSLNENKMPFARHCLCVAAMIASNSEVSKIYSLCSSIAMELDDMELAKTAAEAASRANPNDPNVQLVKLLLIAHNQQKKKKQNENDEEEEEEEAKDKNDEEEEEENSNEDKERILKEQLDLALLAFEYGATHEIISNIPQILLKLNKPLQALGFALSSNDNELISACYEALGKYEISLKFTEDEETKERLNAILGKDQKQFEVANLMKNGEFEEAISALSNHIDSSKSDPNSIVFEITKAVCLANNNNKKEAAKLLLKLRKKVFDEQGPSDLLNSIDRLILLYSPSEMSIGPVGVSKNFDLFYLKQLKKTGGDEKEASNNLVKRMPRNPDALKLFLIQELFKGYNTKVKNDADLPILDKARVLVSIEPSRKSHMLLLSTLIKEELYNEAYSTLQKLCVLDPDLIVKSKSLMEMLSEKVKETKSCSSNNKSTNDDFTDNHNNNDDDIQYAEYSSDEDY